MTKKRAQGDLGFAGPKAKDGPVKCLGMTFESDDARRAHYLGLLREKLQDPEFRRTPGFPSGSDDAILRLSDPPYFTACPNPFLSDILAHVTGASQADNEPIAPFAFDVKEGRHTWLYKAHTYHTKVPPKALVHFLEHYSRPGDVILDGFAGSGMTAVAGMMASPPRSVFVCDLSPAAAFIASSYVSKVDPEEYRREGRRIADQLDAELGWMYTPAGSGSVGSIANYYVWSDVFRCSTCAHEIVFADAAFDQTRKSFASEFPCQACGAMNSKRSERALETLFDHVLGAPWTRYKQVLVSAAISKGGRRADKRPTGPADQQLIDMVRATPPVAASKRLAVPMLFRSGQWGDQWKNCLHLRSVTHAHQMFAERQLHYISRFLELLDLSRPVHRALLFTATSVLQKTSRLMVYNADGIGRVQKGTLYISSVWQEMRFSHMFRISVDDMLRAAGEGLWSTLPEGRDGSGKVSCVWAGSATSLPLPDSSIDYVFVDPPFGANIPYSELNFLWEALLGVFTSTSVEAIESGIQGKSLADYQGLMERSFAEFLRVLRPGRWITVEFHNSKNAVWNAIQAALMHAGFVVADVRVLDKEQVTFKQATTAGAVKKDLVISAYRPSVAIEEQFRIGAGSPETAWEFTRSHLRQLPVFVARDGSAELIGERRNYLLFDRMVAFHVQRGVSVPLSAAEFYTGLTQRFPERETMYFLPEQVAEYDRKRTSVSELRQLSLFVNDEASAIQWVRQQLQDKPQTFQDLQPQFMRELQAWAKHEAAVELKTILEQSFLQYDGRGPVPSQVHSYLSSNFKDLRNLDKTDPRLVEKARERWYVPDPNKQADLEQLRERSLLKEFEEYKTSTQRKLKVFRTEAVRVGFKACWQERDYGTIVKLAEKLPDAVLQEDEKLLMYYDNALTRLGDE